MKDIKVLSIGGFSGLGDSNTCLLRNNVLRKICKHVDCIDTTEKPYNLRYRVLNKLFKIGFNCYLPDLGDYNKRILDKIQESQYDLIWIDKGIVIKESVFLIIKQTMPKVKIIGYSPDYMLARHNQSRQFLESLKHYDYYITTKSYSVTGLQEGGCQDVILINNAYQEGFHKPYQLTKEEILRYGCDVGFIGAWEEARYKSIEYLLQQGVSVKVWGSSKWEKLSKYNNFKFAGRELLGEDYCKAICGCKIALCFLRKKNLDLQTTRSMEIPACGVFMLAERTIEHTSLFEEGSEAEFFSNNDELVEKCIHFLKNPIERKIIAEKGFQRCLSSNYSYDKIIINIINNVFPSNNNNYTGI